MSGLGLGDTSAESNVNQCSATAGSAANKAEEAMSPKYITLASNYIFRPIPIETTDVAGKTTLAKINEIGQ